MKADWENQAESSLKAALYGFRCELRRKLTRELYRSSGDAIKLAKKGPIKFATKFRTKFATKFGGWVGGLALLSMIPAIAAEPMDTWHWRHPLPAGHALRSIIHDGQQFVAVGDRTLMTSQDGATWVTQMSAEFEGLEAIAAGAGRRVGVGAGGTILVSESGSDWELIQSGLSFGWKQVEYLENAFIAVGENGNLAVSPDGVNWVDHRPDTVRGLNGVAHGENLYVSIGEHLTLLRSADGRNWTTRIPISGSANLRAAAFGAGVFVAVGGGLRGLGHFNVSFTTIVGSANGVSWADYSPLSVDAWLMGVVYHDRQFVAAGLSGTVLQSLEVPEAGP